MTESATLFRSRWFLTASVAGTTVMAVAWAFGDTPVQIAIVGSFVSVLSGLLLTLLKDSESALEQFTSSLHGLVAARSVMTNSALRVDWESVTSGIQSVAENRNALFQTLACERIRSLGRDFGQMERGVLTYFSTEAWRHSYSRILNQPSVREYRSVAWIRSPDYWQDHPGQQSLELNLELVDQGVAITRIMILRKSQTCDESGRICKRVADWIQRQHDAGINVLWLFESELDSEKELLVDIGIYGSEAIGILDINARSETICFRLSFHQADVEHHTEQWNRLLVYARPWPPKSM